MKDIDKQINEIDAKLADLRKKKEVLKKDQKENLQIKQKKLLKQLENVSKKFWKLMTLKQVEKQIKNFTIIEC